MAAGTDHERNEDNVHEDGAPHFLDSVSYLPCSLRKLHEAFGLTASKSWYSHNFNTEGNLENVVLFPDASDYGANEMSEGGRRNFLA